MIRAALIACLLGSAAAVPLQRSSYNSKNYCYGYKTQNSWCWLTSDGKEAYVKEGDGGYKCSDYDGYDSGDYCKGAKEASGENIHRAKHHVSAARSTSSPWSKYLADVGSGAKQFDWIAACKSLGQTPSGYSMSSGGGKTNYHLTCDSNKITVVCTTSNCESSYKPPAVASDTPPTGEYAKQATKGNCGGLSQEEVQAFLNIHNKMRCAVGAPPVEWDGALQCQAQRTQNSIGAFKHSHSYAMAIPAGENLATGDSVMNAAWMWFTEYLQSTNYAGSHETGHFSAMSWKSVTKIGCGHGKDSSGKGVIRCQYAGASKSDAPNMGGAYSNNLTPFYGRPSQFSKCGLTGAEVKSKATLFKKWGILHPTGQMASNIGLYSITDSMWSNASPIAFFSACAFLGAAAMVAIGVAIRRRRSPATTHEDLELLSVEEADGLE